MAAKCLGEPKHRDDCGRHGARLRDHNVNNIRWHKPVFRARPTQISFRISRPKFRIAAQIAPKFRISLLEIKLFLLPDIVTQTLTQTQSRDTMEQEEAEKLLESPG